MRKVANMLQKMPSVIENQRIIKDRCLLLNKLIVNNIYCIFFVFCFIRLLSDAELREDVAEDLVRGDLSGDGAQVVEDVAELLAQQVGGAAGAYSAARARSSAARAEARAS